MVVAEEKERRRVNAAGLQVIHGHVNGPATRR